MPPHPLLMNPVLMPKVWGGRRLVRFGKALPAGAVIGESWELADMVGTSASGAGGEPVRSVVATGEMAGRTLREAGDLWGSALMGDRAGLETCGFPLLIKLLDAAENLSVQVHPSPAYAAAHPEASLKTESWCVLAAEPSASGEAASVYIGLRPGVALTEFAAAARAQSPSLPTLLNRIPAVVGECHTLPSGTVHALGAGVVAAEVQTPSDTTFRLHDWGRTGRGLHVEEALASMADPAIAAPERGSLPAGSLCGRLARTPFYTIDEARPLAGDDLTIGYACRNTACAPFVVMVLSGQGELWHAEQGFAATPIGIGQTWLIPAAVAKQTRLRAAVGLRVLRVGLGND